MHNILFNLSGCLKAILYHKINKLRRVGNLLPTRFYSTIGKLKNILHCRCIFIRHPNAFATQTHSEIATPFYRTARNDEYRRRVGIPAHRNAIGVDYLLIFKKIPPYRAAGGLTRPPYNICIYCIEK
ncbi:MAG: hypothetical protein J6M43_07420 [Neisseriaceae bacterium]|nr:hypothetical protein [Neisseriaceae bacterium]